MEPLLSVADESTVLIRGDRFKRFIRADRIQKRVRELGAEISSAYDGHRPIMIGVLNGAYVFLADLMREISIDCEMDFLKLSSYGAEKVSSGKVRELKKIDADIAGRHVIVVEDIVDTGLSIRFILDRLAEYNPASMKVATFLHKPDATREEVQLDYVGFEIPDLFVVGYGLDYGQVGRNLPDVYAIEEE